MSVWHQNNVWSFGVVYLQAFPTGHCTACFQEILAVTSSRLDHIEAKVGDVRLR